MAVSLLLMLYTLSAWGQTGYVYVRLQPGFMGTKVGGVHLQQHGSDFKYTAATYAADGTLYYSFGNALISLTGKKWHSLTLHRYIAGLASHNDKIYVGCVADFGQYDPAQNQYTSLRPLVKDLKDIDYVFSRVVAAGGRVGFYDERMLALYDPQAHKVTTHHPADGAWDGIFRLGERLYVVDYPEGLFQVEGDKLVPVALDDDLPFQGVIAAASADDKLAYLVVCGEVAVDKCITDIYTFDGETFEPYASGKPLQSLLPKLDITHIGATATKLIVVDRAMGAFVLLRESGVLISRLNVQSGLSSNLINSLVVAPGDVAIFGHEKDLSFAYLELGVHDFSAMPGLVGQVTTFVNLANLKLVGTDDGLYTIVPVKEKVNIAQILAPQTDKASKKKSSKKKNKKAPVTDAEPQPKVTFTLEESATGPMTYAFQKLEGFNTPCRKLLVHNGHILAFGNGMLYIYGMDLKLKARTIFQTQFSDIYQGPDNRLYLAYGGQIQVFDPIEPQKISVKADAMLNAAWTIPVKEQAIQSLCIGPDGNLWFTTEKGVYHLEPFADIPAEGLTPQSLPNANGDYTVWSSPDLLYCLAGANLYTLAADGKPNPIGNLSDCYGPGDMVRTNAKGDIVIISKHNPNTRYTVYVPKIGPKGVEKVDTVKLLCIVVDDSDFQLLDDASWLWMGWRNKLLYINLKSKNATPKQANFRAEFSAVSVVMADSVHDITLQPDPDLARGVNVLRFNFVSNDLYNPERVIYYIRYHEDDDWTPIEGHTYSSPLPHGDYDFEVRAVNVFGQVSQSSVYSFNIPPPWYRSWWFYVLLVLAGLGIAYWIIRQREARSRREQTRLKAYGDEMRALAIQEQEKRIEAEKLGVLGSLVANVAHELNTPLGAIKGSIGLMDETLAKTVENIWAVAPSLPAELAPLVLQLIKQAAQAQDQFSTREERQFRGQIEDLLSVNAIPHADSLARQFVRIGVVDSVDRYLPLLRHEEAERFLGLAFETGRLFKYVSTIKSASEKTDARVKALKLYTYQSGPSAKVEFDLTDNIQSNVAILDNKLRSSQIEFSQQLEPLPQLLGYPDRLGQVWINVVDNAIYALKGQGRITIRSRREGSNAIVEIEDNGPGIPPEIQEKIFVRFFTTKPKGEGTGLGLDICRQIVEEHGGTFNVQSEPGRTVFVAVLPLHNP